MPRNTTQVIFECPEAFRRRLQQQKLKRGISVKQMIMKALEEYWSSEYSDKPQELITMEFVPYDTPEKCHWADMFVQYLERCPRGKVQLLKRVIEEDLKVHRARKAIKERGKLVIKSTKRYKRKP
jgi:hypothetical protein